MFQVLLDAVLPVFSIILLGYALRLRGFIHPDYTRTASRVVYYVALPAMLFDITSKAPFSSNFDPVAVLCDLAALGIIAVLSFVVACTLDIRKSVRGTFLQSCFHGNIGYTGYAIAYYALGKAQFAQTAILSSFLMVGQNVLAVWALTAHRPDLGPEGQGWTVLKHSLTNPIILSIVAAVACSATGLPVPHPVRQALDILSGMALPAALLLIGSTLSFGAVRSWAKEMTCIGAIKLVGLPLLAFLLMRLFHVPHTLIISGVILLASPPATITYIMAGELGGSPELAASSISVLTLFSAITYSIFLSALMP
jgi:predicted permease